MLVESNGREDISRYKKAEKQLKGYYPESMLSLVPEFFQSPFFESHAPGLIFLLNFSTRGYEYISPNVQKVFSLSAEELKEGGLVKAIKLFPPFHQTLLLDEIFPRVYEAFEKSVSQNKSPMDLRIKYTLSMYNKENRIVKTLHILKPVTLDKRGLPLICLKYLLVIDEDPTDNDASLVIERDTNKNNIYTSMISKEFKYFNQTEVFLSRRELEIVDLAKMGLPSKEIADKLCISVHTVHNHRKNILKKYDCNNLQQVFKILESSTD